MKKMYHYKDCCLDYTLFAPQCLCYTSILPFLLRPWICYVCTLLFDAGYNKWRDGGAYAALPDHGGLHNGCRSEGLWWCGGACLLDQGYGLLLWSQQGGSPVEGQWKAKCPPPLPPSRICFDLGQVIDTDIFLWYHKTLLCIGIILNYRITAGDCREFGTCKSK